MTDNEIIQEATEATKKNLNAGCYVGGLLHVVKEQQAKIERLQKEREKLIKECKQNGIKIQKIISKLQKQIKTAKSEAIKEFAERLKALPSVMNCEYEWLHIDIDSLVKEMEDKNG